MSLFLLTSASQLFHCSSDQEQWAFYFLNSTKHSLTFRFELTSNVFTSKRVFFYSYDVYSLHKFKLHLECY